MVLLIVLCRCTQPEVINLAGLKTCQMDGRFSVQSDDGAAVALTFWAGLQLPLFGDVTTGGRPRNNCRIWEGIEQGSVGGRPEPTWSGVNEICKQKKFKIARSSLLCVNLFHAIFVRYIMDFKYEGRCLNWDYKNQTCDWSWILLEL